jgi:hypothetical protein
VNHVARGSPMSVRPAPATTKGSSASLVAMPRRVRRPEHAYSRPGKPWSRWLHRRPVGISLATNRLHAAAVSLPIAPGLGEILDDGGQVRGGQLDTLFDLLGRVTRHSAELS